MTRCLLLTSFYVDPDAVPAAARLLGGESRLYASPDGEMLIVTPAPSVGVASELATSPEAKEREARLASLLRSDWRRSIIDHVEDVRISEKGQFASRYLQLRYIEVPRSVHGAYLEWREATIFEHVRAQQLIESFVAYHTLVSTKPGVVFLSGFSCDPKDYLATFDTPHYRQIVQQAGDRYIFGGKEGLSTKVYERI